MAPSKFLVKKHLVMINKLNAFAKLTVNLISHQFKVKAVLSNSQLIVFNDLRTCNLYWNLLGRVQKEVGP